jgi:hypothetical protein
MSWQSQKRQAQLSYRSTCSTRRRERVHQKCSRSQRNWTRRMSMFESVGFKELRMTAVKHSPLQRLPVRKWTIWRQRLSWNVCLLSIGMQAF